MDADLIKLLADYILATVFLVLYVRESTAHRLTLEKVSEQRRVENAEHRDLLYKLARLRVGESSNARPELDSSPRIPIQKN